MNVQGNMGCLMNVAQCASLSHPSHVEIFAAQHPSHAFLRYPLKDVSKPDTAFQPYLGGSNPASVAALLQATRPSTTAATFKTKFQRIRNLNDIEGAISSELIGAALPSYRPMTTPGYNVRYLGVCVCMVVCMCMGQARLSHHQNDFYGDKVTVLDCEYSCTVLLMPEHCQSCFS